MLRMIMLASVTTCLPRDAALRFVLLNAELEEKLAQKKTAAESVAIKVAPPLRCSEGAMQPLLLCDSFQKKFFALNLGNVLE